MLGTIFELGEGVEKRTLKVRIPPLHTGNRDARLQVRPQGAQGRMTPEGRQTLVMYGIEDTPQRVHIRLDVDLFVERVFRGYIYFSDEN